MQPAIADKAQSEDFIDYTQADSPVKTVLDIVKVLAVYLSIAKATHLSISFHRVALCRRSKSEELPVFVSVFRGLVVHHLQNADF